MSSTNVQRKLWPALIGALAVWGTAGCGHELVSRNPDPSRKMAPLPACIHRLDPRGVPREGLMRRMDEEEYWQALFAVEPSKRVTVSPTARDCRGEQVLQSNALSGATMKSTPFEPDEEDIVFGGGPDRLRIAWLKTHRDGDAASAGPLIMVRTYPEHAEIYGVGVYRGLDQSRFNVVRSGNMALVLAKTDTCARRPKGAECLSMLDIFQSHMGELANVGGVVLERVGYADAAEKGLHGKIEYHLVAVPFFEDGAVRLHEQMTVTDELGREFRRAELDRYFEIEDGRLRPPRDPSLWDRFFQARDTGDSEESAPASETTEKQTDGRRNTVM